MDTELEEGEIEDESEPEEGELVGEEERTGAHAVDALVSAVGSAYIGCDD